MRTVGDEALCRIIGSAIPQFTTRGPITPSMRLQADLGMDSVGLMTIIFLLEEEVGIDAFRYVREFISAEHVSDIIAIVRQN
jgi:acyl carrier protein